jgi:serine protease Do
LDHDMDCALMKITDPGPWPHAEIGNPLTTKVGDWVLALGHPGGFDPERPVVARLGRIIRLGPWLQTDCTLIGGDSGGPLFDMRGQVVGIHSRISDSTVENFHVPAKAFVESWARLAKGDEWGGRPTIGVNGVDFQQGCRLERVPEDGPAYKAGLRVGDIILRVQDEPVIDAACLTQCIGQTKPGDEITLLIDRAGTEFPVNVKVGVRHRMGGRGWRGP